MQGIHAVLQDQCPICHYSFMLGAIIIMRVIKQNINRETNTPYGVMVEYIHEWCAPLSERRELN